MRIWTPALLLTLTTAVQAASLVGFAELPADTFIAGPTSGQFIEPVNGRNPPFLNQQPVQGVSSLVKVDKRFYLALSDNGFGTRKNSSDYLLSWYRIHPEFRTRNGGNGSINIDAVTHLSDPDHHLPYTLVRPNDGLLTGADLDPESFRKDPDGSVWVGEEFMPAVLHFDQSGKLLAPPFRLAGLASDENPNGETATLPRSRGFEGMAQSPDGKTLYPMLEGEVSGGQPGLNIYTFDTDEAGFLNKNALTPSYRYRLDAEATAIGDFTLYNETQGLVIERDSREGAEAVLKRVYRIDFTQLDEQGYLDKNLVADLLHIEDPDDLNQDGQNTFTFPFWTIESLAVEGRTTITIINDNNYPLGSARGTAGDSTEMIMLKVDPLWD